MAEKSDQSFIVERTRALALMHLSRRRDLAIKEPREKGTGLDLLISIVKENEPPVRQFGMALGGSVDPATEEQLARMLRPAMKAALGVGHFPYPVGLLHFTMQDDQGYFTWLAEPTIDEGSPRLLLHSEPHCRKFDRDAMDRIVGEVDRWYEAFFARIAVKAS